MTVSSIMVFHVNVGVVYDTLNTEEDRRTPFQKEICRHYYAITGYIGEEGDIVKSCNWLFENGIYKLVAHLSVKDERTEIGHLEHAWRITNTIDRYWPENAGFVAGNTLTVFGKKHRSSSVGDLFTSTARSSWPRPAVLPKCTKPKPGHTPRSPWASYSRSDEAS